MVKAQEITFQDEYAKRSTQGRKGGKHPCLHVRTTKSGICSPRFLVPQLGSAPQKVVAIPSLNGGVMVKLQCSSQLPKEI